MSNNSHTDMNNNSLIEDNNILHSQQIIATSSLESDDVDEFDWEEWDPTQISFLSHMLAGSMAGLAEHVSLYPVDTIKTHVQCYNCTNNIDKNLSPVKDTFRLTHDLIRKEGLLRLWRGVSAMFAGCIPAHASFFATYEFTKKLFGLDLPGHHPIAAMASGAISSLSHDAFMTPFDVVKQRMQLGYYHDVFHCVKQVVKNEGILAFYIGLPLNLLINIPYNAIVIPVNESMKKILNPKGDYSLSASLMSGTIAGGVASALTTPLDVIKTKLQTANLPPCQQFVDKNYCIKVIKKNTPSPCSTSLSAAPVTATMNTINTIKKINYSTTTNPASSAITPTITSTINTSISPIINHRITIKENPFKLILETSNNIYIEQGIKGFYRGILPRMLYQAPSVAISWSVYETCKSFLGYSSFNIKGRYS